LLTAKEASKRKIERVIRREFAIEIRKKEEEIELINEVYCRQLAFVLWSSQYCSH